MNKEKIYNRRIKEIIGNERVLSILLIGASARAEKVDFNSLRDIDLFVITDENYGFEREVIDIEGMLFDISYMSLESFKKGIDDKITFLINSLQSYRLIYNIDINLEKLLNKLKSIYKEGPIRLEAEEIDYIRFKLYQDYGDILSRKEDILNTIFLMNKLFYDILISYFKLNGYWIPKDKKLLNRIQNIDDILYNLGTDFIKEEDLEVKLRELYNILDYTLKPHGGVIKFWKKGKFPLF